MKIIFRVVLFLFGFMILSACQTAVSPESPKPDATPFPPLPQLDTEAVALGKTVYEQHCAACHGLGLEGQPDWKNRNDDGSYKAPPHNADGHTWHHPDWQLIEAIQLGGSRFAGIDIGGTSPMPAYDTVLNDAEITAVLTYIKSTWPEDVRQMQWEVTNMSSPPQPSSE